MLSLNIRYEKFEQSAIIFFQNSAKGRMNHFNITVDVKRNRHKTDRLTPCILTKKQTLPYVFFTIYNGSNGPK